MFQPGSGRSQPYLGNRYTRVTPRLRPTMSLIISNELVQASGLSESELLQELVLLLFQQEKITLGSASRFLGMTQLEFQALLAEKDLYVHYDVDELYEDVKNLQELGLL
ncbi:MAG: UPF0175 family protein [Oculatellaceae cyanobacterium bins.114]|nr:UPF0175 family protein [Oculatellaceae cyanobacterium bins.114]